jgi:hypothetical protein
MPALPLGEPLALISLSCWRRPSAVPRSTPLLCERSPIARHALISAVYRYFASLRSRSARLCRRRSLLCGSRLSSSCTCSARPSNPLPHRWMHVPVKHAMRWPRSGEELGIVGQPPADHRGADHEEVDECASLLRQRSRARPRRGLSALSWS